MSSTRRAYAAWVGVCVIWGTTYLAIRVALETIPPLLMAAMRWLAAGALITAVLTLRGERLPSAAALPRLAILGLLLLGFGNGGVVWAEQTVPSGLTAVIVATAPFWIVGVEAAMKDGEPLTATRVAGLGLGFTGILFLVGPDLRLDSNPGFLGGVIAAQVACAGWAVGSAYAKRPHADESVLGAAAVEMLFGGLILLVAGTIRNEWAAMAFNGRTTLALLYLIVVGAVGGFCAYLYALKHLPVSFVSLYAYINPVIAVVLGTLLLRETFSWRTAVSATTVLAGMALVRR